MTFHAPEDDEGSPISKWLSWGVILGCIGYLLYFALTRKPL